MSNPVAELISVERTAVALELVSKKRALETLSEMLASTQSNLTTEEIFSCLLRRERLGSTGVGHGLAIPHGRLKGLNQATGAFIRLTDSIDYQAADEQPVNMLFAMIAPEEASQRHVDTLALLAEMFTDDDYVAQLQAAETNEAAHQLLINYRSAATSDDI